MSDSNELDVKGPITEEVRYKEELRMRLALKEFDGLLISEVKKLVRKLPISRTPKDTFSAMMQEFRMYCLEAINDFDMSRNTKFTSYLVIHLRIRAMQWFNWAWMSKNQPIGSSIVLFSIYENLDNDYEFDPTSYHDNVSLDLELCELLGSLSKKSKLILINLFGRIDEPLIKAFKGDFDRVVGRVAKITGYNRYEVGRFLREIREILPEYIDHIGAIG